MTHPPQHELRRNAVSARHLVFFVVAAAAPLTVSAGFLPLGFLVGGTMLPAAFVIAGIAYTIFAVGFTAMSRHVTDAGAFSAYIDKGLGRTAGSAAAMVAWTGYTLGQIGFAAASGFFASIFLKTYLSVSVPWGLCATVIGLLVTAISYAKINLGARVAAVLLILEIGVLAVFAIAVWVQGGPEGTPWSAFDPGSWQVPVLGGTFLVTFLVFIGFEQTAVYSEEVQDAGNAVRKATFWAIGILTVIYIAAAFTILMAIGPNRLLDVLSGDPSQVVFNLNTSFVSSSMTGVMQLLVITSFIAGVIALQNAGSRYLFSMSRRGLLPAFLYGTSRSGTPRAAVLLQGGLVTVALIGFGLSSLDPYTQVVTWTNSPTLFAVLALQIATGVAVIRWFAARGTQESLWARLIAPALSVIVLGVVLYLAAANMSLLTGLGATGNALIISPLVIAFLFGAVRGRMTAGRTQEADEHVAPAQAPEQL
ncbi:APC family permease [Microbispora sp. H10670]|uniref:APC family permease n=1 Tax=Microbispora sp. H10670 TaxID=2729108 RepID=UPI0016041091|nr:APC family permease [Microbispora sp. H10670]